MEEKKKSPARKSAPAAKPRPASPARPKSVPAAKPRTSPPPRSKAVPAEKTRPAPLARPKSTPVEKTRSVPAEKMKTDHAVRQKPVPAAKPKSTPVEKPKSAPRARQKSEDPEEVRLMKVKMPKSEFDKFDRGETHSQKGIRDKKGKLQALPDVEPVAKEDLPVKIVVKKQKPGVKDEMLEAGAAALNEALMEELKPLIAKGINFAVQKVTDPELYRTIGRKTTQFWNKSVKPKVEAAKEHRKEKKAAKKAQLQTESEQTDLPEVSVPETQDQTTFVVSEEQAAFLVEDVRNEARKLAEKIYVLSHLCIKNEKTDVERTLERDYIQELMSAENQKVIELAAAHPELVGERVALCLSDLQKGYIRTEDKLIKIPLLMENQETENN